MADDWIPIPREDVPARWTERFGLTSVDVTLSPYDVPQAFRINYDRRSTICTIFFRYLTDDRPQTSVESGEITLVLGRVSNRLLEVRINVGQLAAKILDATIDLALPALRRALDSVSSARASRRHHYEAAGQVLTANADRFLVKERSK